MWIEIVSRDEVLLATLTGACRQEDDDWVVKPRFVSGEREHLAAFFGLMIFDWCAATAKEREHFRLESQRYLGPIFLINEDDQDLSAWWAGFPAPKLFDVVPKDAPSELLRLRLEYARASCLMHATERAAGVAQAQNVGGDEARHQLADVPPFLLLSFGWNGRPFHLNATALTFFGMHPASLSDWNWREQVHPDDRTSLTRDIQEAFRHGQVLRRAARLRRADGAWRWMQIGGGPFFDHSGGDCGYALSLADITEAKEANDELRRRREKMQNLADSLPIKVCRIDETFHGDYFNDAWDSYIGCRTVSLTDAEWAKYIPAEDLPVVGDAWREAVRDAGYISYESRFKEARTGRFRWHLIQAVPIKDEKGKTHRWISVTLDIDDSKRETDTIARLYSELLAINRSKDTLLLALPDEMRAPLRDILGHHSLLDCSYLSSDDRSALEAIFRNTDNLLHHVDNLLDMAHLVSGRMVLHTAETDLVEATKTVLASFRSTFQQAGVTLEANFQPDLKPVVLDPGRYRQAVWSLLSNALKFTPPGGRVRLDLHQDGDDILLAIEDNGKGIASHFLPSIFDYFSQEEKYWTRHQGGLGLGLAIVKHIVDLHGGRIKASSPGQGKGASFEVRFPITRARAKT